MSTRDELISESAALEADPAESRPPLAAYLDHLLRFAHGLGLDEAVAYRIIDDVAALPSGTVEGRVAEIRRRMLAAA